MTSLLRRVKTKLAIHAHRRVRGLLDGEYRSIFHGRTIEFDDLRPYVAGDEPRDIDWKATARHGAPLVRRYIATRKQTVLLLVDTGRNMAALAESGETKSELSVLATGIIGYLALKHGDRLVLVSGDAEHTKFEPPASTEAALERLLRQIDSATTLQAPRSDLTRLLQFVAKSFTRRMIVLVVADDRALGETEARLLRRLSVQHEILWLSVGDADLLAEQWAGQRMHDVATSVALPMYLRADPALRADFDRSVAERRDRNEALFARLRISSARLGSTVDVVPSLLRLLELHRHAKR
ncbi:uncharacterized protein DUF58 [Glaciihabitans tibetensis]|uniref:Uncharacterized protein DUF58 n=1 Tax=Glaciihabitans tibetensis TaxID=1266600 RepID=A0A2T0VHE7_9MICO|nr:DUF58 domain-containing protein [Glaciihabitans tibetensis]PRY69638.1 uncharacterized protein DUF58 [Glaciihabitans tibetensis]